MKLKKLEITGFKSFHDKAVVDFPQGISAVVGPNGCGKSNIVDAIRWVMGEQSVKQLRGKSMEDIIFSGTNGKAPLNMAEVSLTLSNERGDGPEELKDFTEINLTRRLYRSGESGYFLNKQPCRLKDIHNVFLGSGLGSKSYAVIQQGNIGAITEASPEERRYFIEEAAGTTRYKNRKTEALRKIEITRQNLLRVEDILVEIKRQMSSLKRQARKAEFYNNYQKRIQKLDVQLGFHYYDTFSQKIEKAAVLIQELKDSDIGDASELKKLDAAVEEIKLQRWQKNQEIADQKSQKFENQRGIDRMENDLGHLRAEIERLSGEITELDDAGDNLEQKNQDMLSEIEQGEKETVDFKDRISRLRVELEGERTIAEKRTARLSGLNRELESRKAQLMDLVAREAQYKNIYQNAANNKDSLERRLKRTDEEEVLVRRDIKKAREEEARITAELESITAEIKELEQFTDTTRRHLEKEARALADQIKQAQTLELERNTNRSQYNTLKKMEQNFEWYRDGVKAVMKNADLATDSENLDPGTNSGKIKGIISMMADVIDAEPSYETAVEAVLGESLQYIIVEDQGSGLNAIDYLQNQAAGRSGFIPVSAIKTNGHEGHRALDPSMLLLNHVSVKPGFEKIAEALLGQVVLTQTIQQAVDLFNRNGSTQTIVTINGDVISQYGILVGGSKDKLSGILAKKQEIKELSRRGKEIEKELDKAQADQAALEADVRELETTLQQQIEQKNLLIENKMAAEKAQYTASQDVKNATRRLEIITLEQEQLLGEASDIADEMTKYDRALAEITANIKETQETVAEKANEINIAAAEMEEFNQKVVNLKLELTALSAKLENSNNSLRRLKEFRSDSLNRLEQLTREINQKKQKEKTARDKVAEYKQDLAKLYRNLEGLGSVLEQNESAYQEIDAKLQESDTKINAIKDKREKTNEKFRMLELEQSQRKLKRENIVTQIEERYHASFSELRSEHHRAGEEDTQNSTEMTVASMEEELSKCRTKISKIVDVNLGAIKEYEQLKDRFEFLETQRDDLVKAIEDLYKVIKKINTITQSLFTETFELINQKLDEVFPRLFDGGTAKLVLTEPEKPLETGVELMIHPPGKKLTRLSLLSGGEKALSAIAFVFAIFLIKPASFCLLDEIDAPLDEANVFRFNNLLRIIGEKSQIIMITHNKNTMEFADTLFGVTMEQKGVSKVVSVNFERAEKAA